MDSVSEHHPEWERFVVVLDAPITEHAYKDEDHERYRVLGVDDLKLPEASKFLFRYTILEANTAVKPWAFKLLSKEWGYEHSVYLDPDIRLYRSLSLVEEELQHGCSMVLTPHLTSPITDQKRPSETDILRSGAYNLGFAAIGPWEKSASIIEWWQDHLEYDCVVDPDNGLFVDQKWMDLAPGLFDGVSILTHKGYNTAYWNLHDRKLRKQQNRWWCENELLHFFHFSGVDVAKPAAFSKHQNRYTLNDLGDGKDLVVEYCKEVEANGYESLSPIPYGFGHYHSGGVIPDVTRNLYKQDPRFQDSCGDDPFNQNIAFLNGSDADSEGLKLTRLMRRIWEERADLQTAFPKPSSDNLVGFASWFVTDGRVQFQLTDNVVLPVKTALASLKSSHSPPVEHIDGQLNKLFLLEDSAFVKQAYLSILGRAPDKHGREHFVANLRKGRLSREKVALILANSKEAQARRSVLAQRLRYPLIWWLPDPIRPVFRKVKTSTEIGNESIPTGDSEKWLSTASKQSLPFGLNVAGYAKAQHSIGQSARLCVKGVKAADIPFTVYEVQSRFGAKCADDSLDAYIEQHNPYRMNLVHVNADQFPSVRAELPEAFWDSRINIGYWAWELPLFPDRFAECAQGLDEIWVPSTFVADAIGRSVQCPVIAMPHPIAPDTPSSKGRSEFGISTDSFTFLFHFDFNSIFERKNPIAVINAFKTAFPDARRKVELVIKTQNGEQNGDALELLSEHIEADYRVIVIDETFSQQDMAALAGVCDTFVSLHRSEGFGLGLAESMALRKPVIGTGWSGNMDFMAAGNSCLVEYDLVQLDEDYGPYEKGQYWAEPSVEHAAWYMNKLVDDSQFTAELGKKAEASIRLTNSPERIGGTYRRRLLRLQNGV